MQAGRHRSSALRIWWATVLSRGAGVGKDDLFLSGSSSSSLVSGEVHIQISRRAKVLKFLPLVWIWMQASSHPHPMTSGNSQTSTSQASLTHSDGFFELLTHSDLPKSPKFPSLSMVPYWDFCLCLLHLYHLLAHLHLSQASYLNKSISCLPLCLLLNSFCAEAQRTWTSVNPDTRRVILI